MRTALEILRPTGASLTVAVDTFAEALKLLGGNMVREAVRFYLENNPANLPPANRCRSCGRVHCQPGGASENLAALAVPFHSEQRRALNLNHRCTLMHTDGSRE